jgi:kumamolisin
MKKPTKPTHPLAGSARGLRSGSKLIGPSDPKELVEITFRVRSRSKRPLPPEALGALPPLQRTYLTRTQFAARHGAAPADLAVVKRFAKVRKLRVVSASAPERNVKVVGTVKALSAAFDVKLMEYSHPDGDYRGRIGSVHLPKEMAKVVTGVFGLDNRRQAKAHFVTARRKKAGATPAPAYFTAPQVAELYQFPPGDGTGECIALLEFGGGYKASDLKKYCAKLGIPVPAVSSVSVDGVANKPAGDADSDGEVALDMDIVGALAPKAKIVVYFAPFTERGWVDILTAAINDKVNKPSVISISWGFAEGEPVQGFEWTQQTVDAVNETLQSAAAMGVSVCVAAGDDGSNEQISDGHAHTDFPAASPYVLGCGGTRLAGTGSKITSEVVWNDGPGSGGGGGVSDMNPLPAWQQGIVPPSVNPGGHIGRGVPDVSGNADPDTGYITCCNGKFQVVGGTSAVAPLWAALIARINQQLGTPLGYFNPLLYKKVGSSPAIRDITQGNNDTTGKVGGYQAGPGWDAASGWGSPVGTALLQAFGGK